MMEKYLEFKNQQEKIIEKYLKEKLVDLRKIKIHIGFLTKEICLVEHFRLSSEGKTIEAMKCISNEYFNKVLNELYEKYKITE